MDDETRPVKVHRITLLVIDHDDLGADGVRAVLEETRYPNHCIYPSVRHIDTVEVQWNDDHPLNRSTTKEAFYRALFPEETDEVKRLRVVYAAADVFRRSNNREHCDDGWIAVPCDALNELGKAMCAAERETDR